MSYDLLLVVMSYDPLLGVSPKTVRGLCELGPKNDICFREVYPIKCPPHRDFLMRV